MKIEVTEELIRAALITSLSKKGDTPSTAMSLHPFPFRRGLAYFIRTVTYHLVGRVTAIDGKWLTLEDAAWVADSGRFAQAIKGGNLVEVEDVGITFVNIDSITDAFPWKHKLPLETK